jgi:hypothetical protein
MRKYLRSSGCQILGLEGCQILGLEGCQILGLEGCNVCRFYCFISDVIASF